MNLDISGIHHITAIASDPQKNIDFYCGILGLRLVKRTVNFDDPGTYHFYFGDGTGSPGTILTFFPWMGARRGTAGTGMVNVVSFAVPGGSLGFWRERLQKFGLSSAKAPARFEEGSLIFPDNDGLQIELVETGSADSTRAWTEGPIPIENAICGFHSATTHLEGHEHTAKLLTDILGFRLIAETGNRFRYASGSGGPGTFLDLICTPDAAPARSGAGTVHHIAWRARDDEAQKSWREKLVSAGFNVSPVMDRQYFHSIYFREPGGVLFEIATDPPGFQTDESAAKLGSTLRLPPWLESSRERIETILPPIVLP